MKQRTDFYGFLEVNSIIHHRLMQFGEFLALMSCGGLDTERHREYTDTKNWQILLVVLRLLKK